MLIDLADSSLKTKVISSALCADGYDVENLIVNKQKPKTFDKKYFMSEYFVKCPVKVVLQFPFLVDISAIVLNPRGSTHHSKVIEVQAAFHRPMKPKDADQVCSYGTDLSSFCQTKPLNLVAKYNQKNHNTTGLINKIIFYNEHHLMQFQRHQQGPSSIGIPLKPLTCISCCSHLALNVTWATIPVISSLEVWGIPSQRNPIFLKQSIGTLISSIRSNKEEEGLPSTKQEILAHEPGQGHCENNPCKKSPSLSNKSDTPFVEEMPAEFLDPITCAMMTMPFLLPSGNNIDQTTYDRFVATERTYGRLPSDPFTGLVFHGSQIPIPNASLKLRIDNFLLNSNSKDVPKTYLLGSAESNRVSIPTKSKPKASCSSASNDVPPSKRQRIESNHHTELKDSLNDALSKTLFSLPSCFDKKAKPLVECLKCYKTDKMEIYVLPCKHLLCRKCLQETTRQSKKCINCSMFFKHQEVKKYGS